MTTAGPAFSFATAPASEKIPAPMMPPMPMAVSCHRPSVRSSPPPSDSMSSIGLRRRNAARNPASVMTTPP